MKSLNTIHIWNGLEMAKNKVHPYGGDILEIYSHHLLPNVPDGDPWVHAGRNLHSLLTAFCHYHNVKAIVNGKQSGEWLDSYKFIHKCDVRIVNENTISSQKETSRYLFSESSEAHPYQNSERVASNFLEADQSKQLIGELEECKVRKNTGPRLPSLLKNLWRVMSSVQNKKKAL